MSLSKHSGATLLAILMGSVLVANAQQTVSIPINLLEDQSALLERELQASMKASSLSKARASDPDSDTATKFFGIESEVTIESARLAYGALAKTAPDIAKELACNGQNVLIYGPSQSDSLLSLRLFNEQLDHLRTRLKMVLDLQNPEAPDQPGKGSNVFGSAALSGPISNSLVSLVASFRNDAAGKNQTASIDERALIASVAKAAIAEGCQVYWPDSYAVNPFNSKSQLSLALQGVGAAYDNPEPGKPAGIQQKLQAVRLELKRSETHSQLQNEKIESEQNKLAVASKKIDFISNHVKTEKNAELQEKLNKAFEKSWDELDQAVRRQMSSHLPGTIEEQGKLDEMGKRLDLLKTRADWLSQYVIDNKDVVLQDKLKRTLSATWDQLDSAVKAHQALAASVPEAVEGLERDKARWDRYSGNLKELITTLSGAAEAYVGFQAALLDGTSGTSPLSRFLRAEELRGLIFDDKMQERAGSSIVQLRIQKLTGSRFPRPGGGDDHKNFSGGIVLSVFQYEPNGKLKNSSLHTAYDAFK